MALIDTDWTDLANAPLGPDTPILLDGVPMLYAGLTVTFYMRPDYSPVMNDGICKCIEEYLTLAPNPPLLAGLPKRRQWIHTTKHRIPTPCEIVQKSSLVTSTI